MRCWASALLPALLGLAGCAGLPGAGSGPGAAPPQPAACDAYVEAWVGHFRANVARLDGQAREAPLAALERARLALADQGIAEDSCRRPFCIIQPRAGGRLDSYCGYRVAGGADGELYRWVPWTPARR